MKRSKKTYDAFLQKIKDWMLMLAVASLVAIDVIIIVSYTLVEGLRGKLTAKLVPHREKPSVIETVILQA